MSAVNAAINCEAIFPFDFWPDFPTWLLIFEEKPVFQNCSFEKIYKIKKNIFSAVQFKISVSDTACIKVMNVFREFCWRYLDSILYWWKILIWIYFGPQLLCHCHSFSEATLASFAIITFLPLSQEPHPIYHYFPFATITFLPEGMTIRTRL